ncbi:hypothetical protein C8R46DRAFT_1055468 [Mycena filopes]|nr:hypothetical protein C8R46DRAFT_1055468 [Mycena filopes]
MLSRRVPQRAVAFRYASSAATTAPTTLTQGTAGLRDEPPHLHYILGNRVLLGRTADSSIISPKDALAIVRAVERRFGRVAEFRVYPASHSNRYFQNTAYFTLWDPAAYVRVPAKPTRISVKVPASKEEGFENGGIGLADIAPYLDAQDWAGDDASLPLPEEAPTDGSRIIQLDIEHSEKRFQNFKGSMPNSISYLRNSIIPHFVSWGGFAPLKPLPEPVKITRSDLYCGSTIDQPHMRKQLEVWKNWLQGQPVTSKLRNVPAREPSPSAVAEPSPSLVTAQEVVQPDAPEGDVPEVQLSSAEPTDTPSSSADTLPWLTATPGSPPPVPETPVSELEEPAAATETLTEPEPTERKTTESKAAKAQAAAQAKAKAKPAPVTTPIPPAAVRRSEARAARTAVLKTLPKLEPASKPKPKPKVSFPIPLQQGPSLPKPPKPVVKLVVSEEKQQKKQEAKGTQTAEPEKAKAKKPVKGQKEPEPPIEVEERKTGVAARLKGLLGGWF